MLSAAFMPSSRPGLNRRRRGYASRNPDPGTYLARYTKAFLGPVTRVCDAAPGIALAQAGNSICPIPCIQRACDALEQTLPAHGGCPKVKQVFAPASLLLRRFGIQDVPQSAVAHALRLWHATNVATR